MSFLKRVFFILLFTSTLILHGEYIGNLIVEYKTYSGNLVGAIGGGVKEGYKGFSRYFLGGNSLELKFNYYAENSSWLHRIETTLSIVNNLKPDGYTYTPFWESVNDTYKKGIRTYSGSQEWPEAKVLFSMFDGAWESTISSKYYWENNIVLIPMKMVKDSGFYPYLKVKFNFIPNNWLKSIEDDYIAYSQKYRNKNINREENYWDILDMRLGLDYAKGFEALGEKDFFWLLAKVELIIPNIYFKDDPVAVLEKTEFTFLIPKTTFSVMLFQEMSLRYFNRPEAWQSDNIYRSGAIWWNAGVKLAYRMDLFKN